MRFTKPPLTFDEQVELLESRGMVIDDLSRAKRYVSQLNYYRLAAYWLPFEETHSPHRFKPDTQFNTVLEHYIFDRELRLLVMDAIERIEVSLRTQWAYYLAHKYGPHAHLDPSLHVRNRGPWTYTKNVSALVDVVRNSSEIFIRHFDKYDEQLPPLWAVCEVMTLGQLSRWYSNLNYRQDRNSIAKAYGLDEKILTSFVHHLSIVRNTCAHHGRLWNREFTFAWKLPQRTPFDLYQNFNPAIKRRLYNTLVMIAYLMDRINPHSWKQRMNNLFINHPEINSTAMGFPDDWKDRPIWLDITA